MFLLDPFYGYVQGEFSKEEDAAPAKLLLDLVNVMDRMHKDSIDKLQVGF